MKKIFLLLTLFFVVIQSQGQVLSDYAFSAFTSTYSSVSGGTGPISYSGGGFPFGSTNYDDCYYNGIPIGFNFVYCGNTYTTVNASANAWIVLSSTAMSFPTGTDTYDNDLPNTVLSQNLPRPILAALWSDLITAGANVYYSTTGSSPNRIFTIEWQGVGFYGSGTTPYENVEIKLYETSNIIDFAYSQIASGTYSLNLCAIGITDGVGTYPATGSVNYWSLNGSGSSPTASMSVDTRNISGQPATNQVYRWSPQCVGTPSAGTAGASVDSGCASYTTVLSLTGASTTLGITYQWQSSPDGSTWTNITGATASTYTATITANTWFRCIVTCSNSGISSNSTSVECFLFSPPASISGPTSVCVGSTITLTDATSGGTWISGTPSVATIGSLTGVVMGVTTGTSVITYSMPTGCIATVTVNVVTAPASISGPSSVCVGATITLTDGTPGGTWSSSNPSIASIGASTGIVSGVAVGVVNITYSLGSCFATKSVTVNASPASISGPSAVCVGSTITLTDATSGGSWSSSSGFATVGASTGVVTGVFGGIVTITYTLPGGCYATHVVTVNPLPSSITGLTTLCVGQSSALFSAGSGTWTSSNTAIATVGASTGIVTGVSAGSVTITFTLPTGCYTTFGLTVYPLPLPITGSTSICVGGTSLLSDASGGGYWTSSDPTVGYVDPGTGLVTGISFGTAVISYTIGTGCSATVTVNVSPPPGAITGTFTLCIGGTVSLFDATGGGTWSSGSPGIATIDPVTGVVTGVAAGTTVIHYTLSTGCYASATVTVNSLPPSIGGTLSVCVGLTTLLTDASPGGSWSSSNPLVATIVSTTGLVTGISPGTTTISYTLPGGCSATAVVTVNSSPAPITGPSSVCVGSTITLADIVGGGTWSSGSTGIATVGATTGIVTGMTAGIVTISYSIGAGCVATKSVTVNALPGTIGGPGTVCAGSTITLTDAGGGTWLSSTTAVATIGSLTGIVTGIIPGTTTITYTLPTGCSKTRVITVNAVPSPIAGPSSVCQGSNITMTDVSAGGSWSASPSTVATIGATSGIVTGVSGGITTVTYTIASGCYVTTTVTVNSLPTLWTVSTGGSYCFGGAGVHVSLSSSTVGITYQLYVGGVPTGSPLSGTGGLLDFGLQTTAGTYTVVATNSVTGCSRTMSGSATITVNPLPAPVGGPSAVCVGATITLTDATPGGLWTSTTPGVATISATTGVVTGITTGTTNIIYTLTGTGCSVSKTVTVSPTPGPILGPSTACTGATTTTLTDAVPGGVWSSSAPGIATIGSLTGVVTGGTTGTTTITYSLGSGCTVTRTITVNPSPGPVSGPSQVCVGMTITLTDATTGGAWGSSATGVATVGATTGIVTGVTPGTAIIAYTMPSGCSSTQVVTVNPLPITILGVLKVCVGATTTLSDAVTGGTWSSGSPGIATAGATTGIITGVSAGTSTIVYSLGSGCTISAVVTVNPVPAAIGGLPHVCVGQTTTLSDATSGGTWSTTTPATGTVGATTGIVAGISAGTDTIVYTLPVTGCAAGIVVTVHPLPGPISGATSVCVGQTSLLTNPVPGGTWSCSNPAVATIGSTSGIITGVSFGSATVTYTSGGCYVTIPITVVSSPLPIAGPGSVCVGQTITKTDPSPGGVWSSGNPSLGTIDASSGVVSGISAGTVIISYTLGTTGCAAVTPVVINPVSPVLGTFTVCVGQTTPLSDTSLGGTWSSLSPSVATVNTYTGLVSGVSAGTAVINYLLPTGCTATTTVTVNPIPSVITGLSSACIGQLVPMSDTVTGGTWSSSAPSVATIDATGMVTALSAGTTTIIYTLGTGCQRTKTFTVNPLPPAITGPANVCVGGTVTLSDPGGPGSWLSSTPAVATIGSGSGVVTGISPGSSTITFNLYSTGCSTTTVINVVAPPTAITGTPEACVGSGTVLSSTPPGGTWLSGTPSVASVDATGLVTGLAPGTTAITYSLGAGCTTPVFTFTVHPVPGGIAGSPNVCVGNTYLFTDPTPGGSWSSSDPAVAGISAGGTVTGIATGTATISYTLSTGCYTTYTVVVNPGPSPITGINTVCIGSSTSLSDATVGGTWSSSAPATGSVDVSGTVYGLAAGTTIISYVVPGYVCPSVLPVTVNPLPTPVSGAPQVCQGSTASYSDGVPGGTWSTSDPLTATISPAGLLTAVTTGVTVPVGVTITYTLGAGCIQTLDITVNPVPAAIAGPGTVCRGQAITLFDATVGGAWSSSDVATGSVNTLGDVTGVSPGTVTISYSNGYGCSATHVVTVNQSPGPILGSGNVCLGGTDTLTDSIPGGTWFSLNTTIATIDPVTGVVSGITLGSATIVYQLSGGCFVSRVITVYPLPLVFAVSGGGNHCVGDTGVHVYLSGSTVGVNYMLYLGATAVGAYPGTGTAMDLGLHTVPGTYTVIGTSTATTCSVLMSGSAVIDTIPTVIPSVTLNVTPDDTVCAGATATFTPIPVNGGTAPVYHWSVNGSPVAMTGSYSFIPADGDLVTVSMTSNAACPVPATVSREVTMTVQPFGVPSVTLSLSPNDTVCKGTVVHAVPEAVFAGMAPVYRWIVNHADMGTAPVYTFVPGDGDQLYCILTSNYPCRLSTIDTSDTVTVVVDTPVVPLVAITANPGWVVSKGAYDTLTATSVNAESPTYQWYINGIPVTGATNATFISNSFSYPGQDSVTCMVTSNGTCVTTGHQWIYIEVTTVGVGQVTAGGDITVLPNPNKGTFVVRGMVGLSDEQVSIELTDMIGQEVYREQVMAKGGRLDAQVTPAGTLANGMYLLSVRSENTNKVFHIVIEK